MENNNELACEDVSTKCVMEHICYKYASMVMSGLIESIDYFAGKQGPKVLRRILAKKIPQEMMEALGVDPSMMQNATEQEKMDTLPRIIASRGGPLFEIEKTDKGEYRFILHECHFLPYSKTKGFCNVTAGLMLGFSQMLTGEIMDIEEIQTIAHGGEKCEFIARKKSVGQ